jgi:hypothetical protein
MFFNSRSYTSLKLGSLIYVLHGNGKTRKRRKSPLLSMLEKMKVCRRAMR